MNKSGNATIAEKLRNFNIHGNWSPEVLEKKPERIGFCSFNSLWSVPRKAVISFLLLSP